MVAGAELINFSLTPNPSSGSKLLLPPGSALLLPLVTAASSLRAAGGVSQANA